MNVRMWKFIKRTLQVIAALIVVSIGYLLIDANSEVFATDVAYLECTLDKASPDYFNKIKDVHGLVGYARIQKDHIKDTALLTWLDIDGDSETGTDPTIKMYISSNKYSSKTMNITRSFDRNTLRYRWVA